MNVIWKILCWVISIPVALILIVRFLFPILCYLGLIALSIVFMGGESKEEYQYSFDIEAVQDNNVYVVGRYSVDNQQRYHFLRERDGRIISGTTPANDSSIRETSEEPHVKVYYEFESPFPGLEKWLTERTVIGKEEPMFSKHYEYNIPDGSVKMEYNIDSK